MKPDVAGRGVHFLLQHGEGSPFAVPHFPHLLIEKAGRHHAQAVEIYD